jgi:hypothetical protein
MVRKCPNCGANNADEASFCSKCGQNLAQSEGMAVKPKVKIVQDLKEKPTSVVAPVVPRVSSRISPPGMCFYHNQIPASYVCGRCGRSICNNCAKNIGGMVFCPQCVPVTAPKQDHDLAIIAGYILTIIFGIIPGLAFGIYLLTREDSSAKTHGGIILILGFVMMFVWLALLEL